MKLVKTINVELTRKGFPKEIDAVQYDTGLQLKFIVKDFEIPGGTTATLYAEKPSGKFIYQEKGITISDNTIIIELENQTLTEHGKVWFQITLKNGADTVSTFEMLIKVQKSKKDSGAVESTTVIRAFDEAVEKAVEQINAARDAASKYISESVDPSLSISGKAADAAAVGQEVSKLSGEMVNQELRLLESIIEISDDVYKYVGNKRIQFIEGGYIATNGAIADINNPTVNASWMYAVVSCKSGDEFIISAHGGNAPRSYAFCDADKNIVYSRPVGSVANVKVIAPTNSAFLIINTQVSFKGTDICYIGDFSMNKVERALQTSNEALEKTIYDKKVMKDVFVNGGYYTSGGGLYIDSASNYSYTEEIFVPSGYTINFTSITNASACAIVSSDKKIKVLGSGATEKIYKYKVEHGDYFRFSGSNNSQLKLELVQYINDKWSDIIKPNFIEMFHNIGIIGDSLSSGEIAWGDSDGNHYVDKYSYSWLSNICRKCGTNAFHYSVGGMTAKNWLSSSLKQSLLNDSAKNAYFIALGTNDKNSSSGYSIGSISDAVGANTFVGYYKNIIEVVHAHAPNSIIFVMSLYNDAQVSVPYTNMIKQIADLYEYCYFVDFVGNIGSELMTTSANKYVNYGHYTTAGYVAVADVIQKITNDIVESNLDKSFFKFFASNQAD